MPLSFRLWDSIAGTGEGGTGFSLCENPDKSLLFSAPAKAGASQAKACALQPVPEQVWRPVLQRTQVWRPVLLTLRFFARREEFEAESLANGQAYTG
jgi:hypothetical protein